MPAFEELEEALGVFLFLISGFFEDVGNLDVAFLAGHSSEVGVAVAGLGFACK